MGRLKHSVFCLPGNWRARNRCQPKKGKRLPPAARQNRLAGKYKIPDCRFFVACPAFPYFITLSSPHVSLCAPVVRLKGCTVPANSRRTRQGFPRHRAPYHRFFDTCMPKRGGLRRGKFSQGWFGGGASFKRCPLQGLFLPPSILKLGIDFQQPFLQLGFAAVQLGGALIVGSGLPEQLMLHLLQLGLQRGAFLP